MTSASDPPATGLTTAEVQARIADGRTNRVPQATSRPLSAIIRANVLTRFNGILGVLVVAVVSVGSPGDALFGLVLVSNSLIGIVQELRAKRTLDRLAVLTAPGVTVRRDGVPVTVALEDVVLDDLVVLRAGDQVPADGEVVQSDELEVDESLLTGEAEPIAKSASSQVLSGSIVVAGSGAFRATAVGINAYAQRLTAETRRFTTARSELMTSINALLRFISWGLLVIGPLLLASQLVRGSESASDAVVSTVAALVGMVPEGLVLLTSIAFFVGALALARRSVLVRELPAVEGLARVDVVCFDKTGTITDGEIRFAAIDPIVQDADTSAALGALGDDPDANSTLRALAAAFPPPDGWRGQASVPFSSARKFSARTFEGRGTWILGAPEVLLNPATASDVSDRVAGLAASGRRVVLLARSDRAARAPDLLAHVDPVALVSLEEGIRPDSADAVRYFKTQNVDLKVMSGDNAVTVAAVAREVGIPRAETPVDARLLPALDADWEPIVEERAVFGRVTPSQKRAFVGALQRRNHVVAMTGDGVNDALALKDADVGVAMGSGAPATRAVAQLVLLDSRFAHVPQVVAEGRRVIANIERVANLFLIKNVYAALLALVVIVIGLPYPFLPRQLTVVSTLTIGIPAFVLSLAPNETRYRPGFLGRVVRFSVPAGVITAIGVMTTYALARAQHRTPVEARAAATVVAMIVGLRVLLLVARPLRPWKVALVLTMGAAFALIMVVPALRDAFKLNLPASMLAQSLLIGALAALALGLADRGLRQDESGTGNVAQS